MNREEFTRYILDSYICARDNPWKKNPDYTVFRHPNNKKWFALIMNKEHWITVALDGNTADDEIKMVLDMSFEATASKL